MEPSGAWDGNAMKSFLRVPTIQSLRATRSGRNTSSKQSRGIQIDDPHWSRPINRGLTGKSGLLRWRHPRNIRGRCTLFGSFCITIQGRCHSWHTIPFRMQHLTTSERDSIVIDSRRWAKKDGGNANQSANGCLLSRRRTRNSVACSKRWIGWIETSTGPNFVSVKKFMSKPVRVISANFLERIGKPTSRFHPDYVAYRNGEIPQSELIARLPHVAMVGDSACMGVHISSAWDTFWRARTCRGNNWFLDTRPAPTGIRSISKRLEELTPFVAIECAGIGALVDDEGHRQNFF